MMLSAELASKALDMCAEGTQVCVARVGDDGTAELALYERGVHDWRMVGDGNGEPCQLSIELATGYDDALVTRYGREQLSRNSRTGDGRG